ncbi:hypothetical protein WAC87_002794 [Shigella flexneri]|nr:hypothetical protein [Escherichia sp. MOD1-EC7003]EHR8836005.1 hypothetical protein [Escherichia coli]MCH0693784.1 hypothetical protein [Escherichia coli]
MIIKTLRMSAQKRN